MHTEFPIGAWAGDWQLVERLHGTVDRGRYLCRREAVDGEPSVTALATVTTPQTRPLDEVARDLAFEGVDGITPLLGVYPLATSGEAAFDVLVEALPEGQPSVEVQLPPRDVKAVSLGLIDAIYAAHAKRHIVFGVRPELVYVKREGQRWVFSGLAPRCEDFALDAEKPCYGVPPLFEVAHLAPELITRPSEPPTTAADIFALCVTIARWMTGQHPFEGEGTQQIMSMATGRRRPWGGRWWSAQKAINAGLHADLNKRPQAGRLKSTLKPAVP